MARYEQCDTVDIGLPPQSTLLCDGVAVLTYRDEPARQRHVADIVGQSIMEDDEREIFSALVKEFAVLTDLTIQRGEPPASGLTVFVLTSPNDSGERARMDDFCQGTVQRWGNHAAWRSCIPRGKPAPTAIDSDRIDILSGDVSVSVVRDTCDGLTALTFAKGPQPKLLVTSIHLQFP